jgi:hypothetical protein
LASLVFFQGVLPCISEDCRTTTEDGRTAKIQNLFTLEIQNLFFILISIFQVNYSFIKCLLLTSKGKKHGSTS